jgi:hypothetical protein
MAGGGSLRAFSPELCYIYKSVIPIRVNTVAWSESIYGRLRLLMVVKPVMVETS